ncbi:MAG TPA: hypothetical protein VFT32_12740 [Candidatus Eisenbacteria bacterium]|nr:hypothetical protein [Candidatus Eisenbacteria bacterium]
MDALPPNLAEFPGLTLQRFARQYATIPSYAAYCAYLGRTPETVTDWRDIPPVPASAFKTHDMSAAPHGAEAVIFETSGTSVSKPGRVRLGSTALYEESLLRSFERHLLPDGARLPAVVFGPRRMEAARSSLWFMVDKVVEVFASAAVYVVRGGEPRWSEADAVLQRAEKRGEPVLLLGTTLFFMAYFEHMERESLAVTLPRGSRAMDTGGAKGQRTEYQREAVETAFARHLGVAPSHLVNEYGMAELGSQFYDDNFLAHHEGRARKPGKEIPPWVRTRALHPETLQEQPDGERGILVHYDLANLDIPLAIQTEDIGSRTGDRLHLEGRLLGAEARGCSLPFEKFLEERGA